MNISHDDKFADQLKNADYFLHFLIKLSNPIVICFSENSVHNIFVLLKEWLYKEFLGEFISSAIPEKDQKIITIIDDFFSDLRFTFCDCCHDPNDYQIEIINIFE
jgi:hypothetical protein